MILNLVNNVVTDRERDLKAKNNLLKERIDRLEHRQKVEEAKREANLLYPPMNPNMIPNIQGKRVMNDSDDDENDSMSDSDGDQPLATMPMLPGYP